MADPHLASAPVPPAGGDTLYLSPSGLRFTDAAELEREYDVDAGVPRLPEVLAEFAKRTARARAQLPASFGLRYGPTLDERLDVFPGRPGGPVVVFLHGGYWRSLHAEDFSCVAIGLTHAGASVVVTNYALAPTVTIDEIVRQHRGAIAWTHRHIADFGADPNRIAVVGHSAGGHGAAMTASTQWSQNYGLPADTVKGVCAISGLFDLRPLTFTSLRTQLRLSAETVLANSPVLTPPPQSPPLLLTYGVEQSDEFIRQSVDMHTAWHTAGLASRVWERLDVNHYDELLALTEPDGALIEPILALTDGHLVT